MIKTEATDEEVAAFKGIEANEAIAQAVFAVFQRGHSIGFASGRKIGFAEGKSALSRWWFPLLFLFVFAGGMIFGASFLASLRVAQ